MISVMLADDHCLIREGLKMLINHQPDMRVSYEVSDVDMMTEIALERKPDVVVINLHIPRVNILEAISQIRQKNSNIKLIKITASCSKECARKYVQAGVSGYVLKKENQPNLFEAIRHVYVGGTFIQPDLLSGGEVAPESSNENIQLPLTPREEEVLRKIALGYTNQEIADHLVLSIKTIETHRAKLMEKLNRKGRSKLVEYAIKNGYLNDVYEQFY